MFRKILILLGGMLIAGIFVFPAFAAIVFGQPVQGGAPGRTGQAGKREPLRLAYLANMGVLVSSGHQKVLIDAHFDKPNPEYRAPSTEVLDKIIKGEAPYDGVDLALVTHNHPDHFAAAVAVIHYWLPMMPDWAKFLQEEFLPDHLALAHLGISLESDAPGKIDQIRKYYQDIFLLLPGMPVKSFP